MAQILGWFWELDASRTANFHGPNPLAWAEIAAWSRLTGATPQPWEIDILRALDRVRLGHKAAPKQAEPTGPPMTPGLFAAMFGGGAK